ncbi:MAG TPA: 50S ribosomal protein L18e [Methanolinea sp.]|jgi:large subunit ribosomal protein L18e|nr:MAG: 50S ribosomal protein L18e [Methanoregulaceae archaeon PtaB.Bin009]OPY41933.1 MAG: 50S ribosomal protein L18e [Methanoregulaceae archaeon PtaU1.Bin066]HII75539.1 50S ribosomal protein L18e [Methanolinea sp.]HNQ30372.1 50S ribosomal protein L18e [Methanolinea sp.]
MKRRTSKKTNPRLVNLISLLKDTSRQNEVNVWRDVAVRLEAPARNYAEVNLSKINRYAGDGETIVVPGKVLGSGMLETSVKIAALTFSQSAATKILEANGQCLTIEELVKDNPKGSRIRVLR